MKRALTVLVLAPLIAACLIAFGSCFAPASAEEDTGAGAVAQGVAQPVPVQGASAGAWVQVPGQSIEGKWIPPHWVWVPVPAPNPPAPARYYAPVPVPAEYLVEPSPDFGTVLADIIFLRPLGIAGLIFGTAAAVVATPFALPSGSMGVVGTTLIVEPYDFTFRRPLGVW